MIETWLKGKKTYLLLFLGAVTVAWQIADGQIPWPQGLEDGWLLAILAALRAAIGKAKGTP